MINDQCVFLDYLQHLLTICAVLQLLGVIILRSNFNNLQISKKIGLSVARVMT